MRVVLVCSSFPATARPAELPSYAAIAVELARRGVEVDVVCKDGATESPESLLRVHSSLRGTSPSEAVSIRRVGRDCRALRRVLGRGPTPVVVVADATELSPAVLSVAGSHRTFVDLSFDWAISAFAAGHAWWDATRAFGGVQRALAMATGAELTPPDFTSFRFFVWGDDRWKDLLIRGLPVQSAAVLSAGVDTKIFRPRDREARPGTATLVFHGTLTRAGGLNAVFLALQRLPGSVRLRILARTTEESYLAELAELGRAAGVTGRIEVVATPSPSVRASILAEADVFVHPREDAVEFPREAFEAFAAGVPVVAARTARDSGHFRDGENSLTFAAGDPRGLAAALRKLLADPETGARLAKQARNDAQTQHGATRSVDGLLSILGA